MSPATIAGMGITYITDREFASKIASRPTILAKIPRF
jgi:hypothetical protein